MGVLKFYDILLVQKKPAKGVRIGYFFGPPNSGKTTLLHRGFGDASSVQVLAWENGWYVISLLYLYVICTLSKSIICILMHVKVPELCTGTVLLCGD